ncbi:hypothetical protein G4B88_029502 [Cannabis sativa]|uniref:Uncharacterized protein n=1 Tax=Cannabis sativa TaxID=3483 RepID=A0A7J6DUJ5_CANSA|nr:hypothetical protein G4B88_029502 [Cannabis sativa]
MAGEAGFLKSLKPRIRIQSEDIKSAALWGFAATTTALWVVQLSDTVMHIFTMEMGVWDTWTWLLTPTSNSGHGPDGPRSRPGSGPRSLGLNSNSNPGPRPETLDLDLKQ